MHESAACYMQLAKHFADVFVINHESSIEKKSRSIRGPVFKGLTSYGGEDGSDRILEQLFKPCRLNSFEYGPS